MEPRETFTAAAPDASPLWLRRRSFPQEGPVSMSNQSRVLRFAPSLQKTPLEGSLCESSWLVTFMQLS